MAGGHWAPKGSLRLRVKCGVGNRPAPLSRMPPVKHLNPTDGSASITEIGRCVLGWQKINGEWKVVWEIWNTYGTPPVQQ